MSKPWEKYAKTAQSESHVAPWEKYAGTTQPKKGFGDVVMENIADVPRQVGLTGRYFVEGLAQMAQPFTEPVRQYVTDPALRAVGLLDDNKSTKPLAEAVTDVADAVGLPQPKNATERVVGDAVRLMAGSSGFMGLTGKAAQGASGVTQSVLRGLSANPVQQLVASAGAGASGGVIREAGGGPLAQAAGAVLGGVGTGLAAQGMTTLGQNIVRKLSPSNAQNVADQIDNALRNSGISWEDVPDNIKQGMLKEVEKALKIGNDLDPTAVSRLLDFKRVPGTTPTRGTLTLDPVQITREQNLARAGANTSDSGLHGLARIQNNNNKALIDNVNQLGANTADDAYTAGSRVMEALQKDIDASQANINNLYAAARDSTGRSVPLNGPVFVQRANDLIDNAMVGGALPSGVRNHMNRIAMGEVPFDVNYAEQLKTQIGKLQRSTNDGQTKYALGLVRQALDDTPLMSEQSGIVAKTTDVGFAAKPTDVGFVQKNVGEEAINAFNQARSANRLMMRKIESSPALKALYNGDAFPDNFVQKFVIEKGAKIDDVKKLATDLKQLDPKAFESVRGQIAQHLKSAAIGNGTADEIGRFSASNFRKALQNIGYSKMSAFFTKEEIARLRAISNVANYMSTQPVGSAVNNSNTAATIIGRGIDLLDQIARNVPILGIAPTANNIVRGFSQRNAQNVVPVLLRHNTNGGMMHTLDEALSPAATYGGMSYLTGEDDQDNYRNWQR